MEDGGSGETPIDSIARDVILRSIGVELQDSDRLRWADGRRRLYDRHLQDSFVVDFDGAPWYTT